MDNFDSILHVKKNLRKTVINSPRVMPSPKNIHARIIKGKNIKRIFKTNDKQICNALYVKSETPEILKISNKSYILTYKISGSAGDVFKITTQEDTKYNKQDLTVALKVMKDITAGNINEIELLEKCKRIVERTITQNLPLVFFSEICKDKNIIVAATDFAISGDLEKWFNIKSRTLNEVKSALMQIFTGIYFFNKELNTSNNDYNMGNILVHTDQQSTGKQHWIYNVNNIKYYVPSYSDIFTLWDFGETTKYIVESKDYKEFINNLYDSMDYFTKLKPNVRAYITDLKNKFKNQSKPIRTIENIFDIFNEFTKEPKNSKLIEEFNTPKQKK